jgi:hypothetical protein
MYLTMSAMYPCWAHLDLVVSSARQTPSVHLPCDDTSYDYVLANITLDYDYRFEPNGIFAREPAHLDCCTAALGDTVSSVRMTGTAGPIRLRLVDVEGVEELCGSRR